MHFALRTTGVLDDQLHARAKAYAARHHLALAALIDQALRAQLSPRRSSTPGKRIELPTFHGDALQPGVSLDDMDTVWDRIDGLR